MTKRNSRRRMPSDIIFPPPERAQHDIIERTNKTIADESGRPSRPYKSVDILTRMERRGAITSGMRQAGEDFKNMFRLARLDPLAAADLSKPFVDGCGKQATYIGSNLDARQKVWQAIISVGGLASAGGSCCWHVLGWERTLKEWALEQGWSGRRVSEEAASGILVAALGVMEQCFLREGR